MKRVSLLKYLGYEEGLARLNKRISYTYKARHPFLVNRIDCSALSSARAVTAFVLSLQNVMTYYNYDFVFVSYHVQRLRVTKLEKKTNNTFVFSVYITIVIPPSLRL